MKTKLLTAIVIAIALSACGGSDKNETTAATDGQKTLRIVTESNFKPFSYVDNQGQLVGFEIDLINALCQEMKAKCEINSQDWDSLIPSLQTNKADAIIAGMSVTPERSQTVDFTDAYFDNTLVLVGKKGVPATINDVASKTVGVQQATVSAEYLAKNQPKASIKTYDKQDNVYLDLNSGRIDFMLSDIVPALDWLKTDVGQNFEVKGKPIDIGDTIAIAVRKDDTLKADFNTALATLKTNGKYQTILGQYFDTEVVKTDNMPATSGNGNTQK